MNDPIEPPGTTAKIHAASALVVAPHYDDEVLGCGGLVAQLAAAGAAVRVLFLSDGGAGAQEGETRDTYRQRRREESALAGEALGIAGSDHLDLPRRRAGAPARRRSLRASPGPFSPSGRSCSSSPRRWR